MRAPSTPKPQALDAAIRDRVAPVPAHLSQDADRTEHSRTIFQLRDLQIRPRKSAGMPMEWSSDLFWSMPFVTALMMPELQPITRYRQ